MEEAGQTPSAPGKARVGGDRDLSRWQRVQGETVSKVGTKLGHSRFGWSGSPKISLGNRILGFRNTKKKSWSWKLAFLSHSWLSCAPADPKSVGPSKTLAPDLPGPAGRPVGALGKAK